MTRAVLGAWGLFFALAGTPAPPQESPAMTIEHSPPPCMDTDAFPLLEARVEGGKPRHLSVHFKSENGSGWYVVEMAPSSGTAYQAALPKPLPSAVRVVYYIESDRPELRSPEYVVNVLTGGCPGSRSAPESVTEDIRFRRTSSDQDEIPVGFSPDGLRSAGRPSRTTLGILAGAAGGAGIAALVATGDEPAPAAPAPPESPEPIRACFTPDPIPDIESGDTVRFDASCTTPDSVTSFQWSFGDGATATGSSVEHLFQPGGVYTVSLTVSDGTRSDNKSRIVQVRATPTACFITSPDPPRITTNGSINFNADCSVGDRDGGPAEITSYVWDFGDGRPSAEGRFVSRQFPRPDLYGVTLTVTNEDDRQDATTQFVVVERPGTGTSRTDVAFTSELALAPGLSAQLSLNDAVSLVASATAPQELRARARSGENVVEGRLLGETGEPRRWRFDFRGTAGFVDGSIRVDRGQVVALDRYGVVFRLDAGEGSAIRFRFRLQ